jgi:thiamine biosynthesis protein ThiS
VLLTINGEQREMQRANTVMELLDELGIDGTVAVERNGEIVRRDEQESTAISSGDALEIVQFVGGG